MRFSWAKVLVSVLLVASYFAMPRYTFPDDGLTGHVLYPLSHANIWHLAANVLCLWMIPCGLHLIATFCLSVLCSFLPCFLFEGTCGFSGVLFAIVGMSWGRVHGFKDMIWRNKWFLIIPVFIPHVNALLHIYCLVCGYLWGSCRISERTKGDWL